MNRAKNYIKNQSIKKNKILRKNKIIKAVNKVVNRLWIIVPPGVFLIFAGVLGYLLLHQYMDEIATIIDFIVASMSFSILVLEYFRKKHKNSYIWASSIYILLLLVGCVAFLCIAVVIKDAGKIARILSCICLGITLAQIIIEILVKERDINDEGEHKLEEKIKKIESESLTRI